VRSNQLNKQNIEMMNHKREKKKRSRGESEGIGGVQQQNNK
jgi:hypothetical protein